MGIRSRLTALLTCGAAAVSYAAVRMAGSVVQPMLEPAGSALPRPAVVALAVSRPAILAPIVVLAVVVVVASEAVLKAEAVRLSVQVVVLTLLVLLLAACLVGFFISFYIPDVHIA